ncbi:MAG: ATP-binding protein [Coriobacteriia bacterium]|nr:ATP-binding protein [Coriobacteriia bacterium]
MSKSPEKAEESFVDARDYEAVLADVAARDFLAAIEQGAMKINRPELGRNHQFGSLGRSEAGSQAVVDAIFTKDMLTRLRDFAGGQKDVFGYLVTLDCFSECYRTFGRVGDWPGNRWEEVWEKKWMRGGRRRVNDGSLAKKFLQADYIQALQSGKWRAKVLDWQNSLEVSSETRELGMEYSVSMPTFHRGRIVGFLNLSFYPEEAARKSVDLLWWLTQSVLCPFLVDAFVALDDHRMEEMVWRLFKLEMERDRQKTFVYNEQKGRWLLDRLYMFCPHHRFREFDEGAASTPADYLSEVIESFSSGCPEATTRRWFYLAPMPTAACIPMPKRPLKGVLWELLTNAYVAVARRKQAGGIELSGAVVTQPQNAIAPIRVLIDVAKVGDTSRVVRIAVEDDGVGMDDYTLHRAFDIGFSGTPSAYESNGLGLKIVRLNVERYGGRVDIMSSEGSGTTVYVTFPD